jgi:hypothetical protein
MKATRQEMRERCAYHEAGHVICSVQLGIGVVRATIRPDRPHFARERFVKYRDHATCVEHLCLICLSGPEAEKLFCGPITDLGDHTDITMAKNFISDAYPEILRGYQLSRLRDAAASAIFGASAEFDRRSQIGGQPPISPYSAPARNLT